LQLIEVIKLKESKREISSGALVLGYMITYALVTIVLTTTLVFLLINTLTDYFDKITFVLILSLIIIIPILANAFIIAKIFEKKIIKG